MMTRFSALAITMCACGGATPSAPSVPVPSSAAPTCSAVTRPYVGTVCAPHEPSRKPAIVIFGGSEGGDSAKPWAEIFAARGYVATTVAYFGVEGTPRTLVEVPVEIAGRALSSVTERADVDRSRIAVLGRSKGGEYALLVASTYPEVRAVVAYVPTPFAWFGLGEGGMPTGCSWSRGTKPLACVAQDAAAGRQIGAMFMAHETISFRESYEKSRADQSAVDKAFFPLERIAGPVLCLAADDDRIWNSRAHCESAIAYLREHGHAFADRMISYPGAGHLFLSATSGPASAMSSAQLGSFRIAFGGTPDADARAADAAWAEIHAFLAKAFGSSSTH
jgi:uncharacterized protein